MDTALTDELSAFDLMLFKGERSPATRSTMGAIIFLDRQPPFAKLCERFEQASRQFIRLRQKVIAPDIAVTSARWVVDADFDLHYHLRAIRLPDNGDINELLEYTSATLADPFDTSRPLWHAYYIEDFKHAGCASALILKVHHAIADGVGSLMLLRSLFDERRRPAKAQGLPTPIPEELDALELTLRGVRQQLLRLQNRWQDLVIGDTAWLENIAKRSGDIPDKLQAARELIGHSPCAASPLLGKRGLKRNIVLHQIPLAKLKAAAKHYHHTLNETYLAGLSLCLRRYHQHHACPIDAIAMAMPVNERSSQSQHRGGNVFSAVNIALPLDCEDTLQCMQTIRMRIHTARADKPMETINWLSEVVASLPAVLFEPLINNIQMPDLQASNVIGDAKPGFLCGAKMTALYPIGPVPGIAIMATLFSYNANCFIGVHVDQDAVTDVALFEKCLIEAFDEICQHTTKKQTVENDHE